VVEAFGRLSGAQVDACLPGTRAHLDDVVARRARVDPAWPRGRLASSVPPSHRAGALPV